MVADHQATTNSESAASLHTRNSVRYTDALTLDSRVKIGTWGWHYRHWRGPFHLRICHPRKMFEWCAHHFQTVELNNTFYRLAPEESLVEC